MAALKAVGLAFALLATSVAGAADYAYYDTAVTAAAHRFNLPQDWIKAVIKTESAGDANAVSVKGALGLMQLMPDTWSEMRDRYGIQGDALNPAANIMAGSAYLAEMRDRFGYPGLFAAYNAGPARYDPISATACHCQPKPRPIWQNSPPDWDCQQAAPVGCSCR